MIIKRLYVSLFAQLTATILMDDVSVTKDIILLTDTVKVALMEASMMRQLRNAIISAKNMRFIALLDAYAKMVTITFKGSAAGARIARLTTLLPKIATVFQEKSLCMEYASRSVLKTRSELMEIVFVSKDIIWWVIPA